MWMMYTTVLSLLFLHHLGSAIFTTNPTNVTTCLGSPAVFTCKINETTPISWQINGLALSSQPPSAPLTSGPGQQSTLTVPGTSQLNGASVWCYYFPSGSLTIILSPPGYLSVQAPPTNLTNTPINATSTILAWVPRPPDQSPSLLYYVVEVINGSGVLVYRGTVTVPQVTITTPDPCDQYKATVSAQYMMPNLTCIGNSSSSKSLGAPPSIIQPTTSLMFPMSPQDTVTVNISLPYQSGVCYYKTVAISGSGMYSFPSVKPLPQNGGQVNTTISLPPNKYFNLIVTASNGYGNTTSSVAISTFGVIGISVNISSPTGLVCLFNPGSLATGCLVSLTDTATGVTYCRVVGRSLDTPVNISLCPFSPSNGTLGTGVYSVEVYVIESDGSVSSVPAITGELVSVIGPSTISPEPSTPSTPNTTISIDTIIGGVVGGIVGIVINITIIIIMIVGTCTALYIRKIKRRMIPRESEFEFDEGTQPVLAVRFVNSDEGDAQVVSSDSVASRPSTGGQPSRKVQYAGVEITNRPFIAPSEGNAVEYAEVKPQGKAPHTKDQELDLSAPQPLDEEQELSTDEKGPEKPKDQDKEQCIADLMEQLFKRNEELNRLRVRDKKLETIKEPLQNLVQRTISVIGEIPTKDQELSAKIAQLSKIAGELDTMAQSIDGHLIHIVKNVQRIHTDLNATMQYQAMDTVTQQRQDMDSNTQINVTPSPINI